MPGSVNAVGTVNGANQLILEGNVANITGIQIVGGVTLPAILQANGSYAVNLSLLPRGHYSYQVLRNGLADSLVSSFDVTLSVASGGPVVQEIAGFIDSNGAYTQKLEIANLPTNAASVTLEYRPSGSSDEFVSSPITNLTTSAKVTEKQLGSVLANGTPTYNAGYQYVGDFNGDGKSDYLWNYNGHASRLRAR